MIAPRTASNVDHLSGPALISGRRCHLPKGTPSEMFILQEGTVAVMKEVAGRQMFVAPLRRGDFFSEMRRPSPDRLGNT